MSQEPESGPVLRPGFVIAARYELRDGLGQGGMGVVYRAYDRLLDEMVALKVLRPDAAWEGRAEMAQRFRNEIKLARAVSHRNVCRIHEYGETDGLRYISMALMDGVNVKDLLRREGAFPPDKAMAIALQVADGLAAIHQEGIVHRDLKTSNLMIDARGLVRVMDFGIAKQTEAPVGMTRTGAILGTPEYMSPEQVNGFKVDARSDVYALGILVYELYTGATPFRAETPVAVLVKHLNERPVFEGVKAAKLPEKVVPILRRALEKRAEDRYQGVEEMARALRHAQGLSGPTWVPPVTVALAEPQAQETVDWRAPTVAEGAPAPRRLPAVLVGTAATALVVMIGAVVVWRGRDEGPRAAPAPTGGPAATAVPSPPPPTPEAVLAPPSDAAGRPRPTPALARETARPPATPTPAASAAMPKPGSAEVDRVLVLAEKELEAQRYAEAIARYDEVLKLDPGNQVARAGRTTAVGALATVRALQGARPAGPGRPFAAGTTSATAGDRGQDPAFDSGFDAAPGMEVKRDSQAASLPGRIEFEAEPSALLPGEKYKVSVFLLNTGAAPLEIRDLVVTTVVDARRSGGAMAPATKVVAPGQKAPLFSVSDFLPETTKAWSMDVMVRTARGETYRNQIAWK